VSGARQRPAGRARNWSWNRIDDGLARALVASNHPAGGDLVLDLGAGDGVITRRLATTGATVLAFELHPARARLLRERFADDPVKVIRADVGDLRLPRRPFRVVANPPFDGVSAILARLTHPASRLEQADIVLPRSVAVAWSDRLHRRRAAWRLAVASNLPRSGFTPRPRIDLVHAVITRR